MSHTFTENDLRVGTLDGRIIVRLRCPGCGVWGLVDEDQLSGRVSLACPNCSFHETHNLVKICKSYGVWDSIHKK